MNTEVALGEIINDPGADHVRLLPSRPKFSNMDPEDDPHGFIYAVCFDNATVKVGRTRDPRQRIGHHFDHGRKFGLTMTQLWCSLPHRYFEGNEAKLINCAAELAQGRTPGTEYFTRLSFSRLIELANALDFSLYSPEDLKAIADEKRSRRLRAIPLFPEPEAGETVDEMVRFLVSRIASTSHAAEEAKALAVRTAARLDAIEERNEWRPALTYAQLHEITGISGSALELIEQKAASIAGARGITAARVPHERFGEVNLYPAWVWEIAFDGRGAA